MIQVVTTVELLPDCLDDFLVILNETVPRVKSESGCVAYEPMVDADAGLPTQGQLRQNTVTLIEAWVDMDALHAHLKAPHMSSFREAAQRYVQDVSHQVLRPVGRRMLPLPS